MAGGLSKNIDNNNDNIDNNNKNIEKVHLIFSHPVLIKGPAIVGSREKRLVLGFTDDRKCTFGSIYCK